MEQGLETARNKQVLHPPIPTPGVLVFFLTHLYRNISTWGGVLLQERQAVRNQANAARFLAEPDSHPSGISRQHANNKFCSFSIEKSGKMWFAENFIIMSMSITAILVDPLPLIELVISRSIQGRHHVIHQCL
jgi:hypothetical protein